MTKSPSVETLIKIYEWVYDNPINEDGNVKPNIFLGEFNLIDGKMDDYSYDVIVRFTKNNKLYILHGREVSGFYHPKEGGVKHILEPLEDNYYVKMYLTHHD